MSTGRDLHTLEQSHGKARLTGPRLSDVGSVPTDADRARDHTAAGRFAPGNQAAAGRSARRALRAPLLAARERIRGAVDAIGASEADRLLADALAVFESARAELGTRSVFAQGPTVAYAVETILAGYFMQEAAIAGFLTPRGLQLHERAMACETQASRAMTAALAATKALAGRPRGKAQQPWWQEPRLPTNQASDGPDDDELEPATEDAPAGQPGAAKGSP